MIIDNEIKPIVNHFLQQKIKSLGDTLEFEYKLISRKRMEAWMPVNDKTKQPFGLLHGGASVALGESLCSLGAWLNIDIEKQIAVGMEINANHIRPVRDGKVLGVAEPIHIGATSQIWKFELFTESEKLVCSGRCTIAVVKKKPVD